MVPLTVYFEVKTKLKNESGKRGLGVKEQFDTAHIAREAIDARLAAEQLQEISNMINLRFGPNTWREIMEERAKRIQEAKEAARQARIAKAKADKELWDDIKNVLLVIGAIFLGNCLCWRSHNVFLMTHAFLLIVYLGQKIISNDMYFNSIDELQILCRTS